MSQENTYNFNDYIQDALRTKPNDSKKQVATAVSMLRLMSSNGHLLDPAKRHLYYNTPVGDLKLPLTVDDSLASIYKGTFIEAVQMDRSERASAKGLEQVLGRGSTDALHALLGLSTEVGEIADAILGSDIGSANPKIDLDNVKEEIGDLFWYMAILCNAYGMDPYEVMEANIRKLRKRFPDKFDEEAAVNRDLAAEKEALNA